MYSTNYKKGKNAKMRGGGGGGGRKACKRESEREIGK